MEPHSDFDMRGRPLLPLYRFREILGDYANQFTDEQLAPMRADIQHIADAIFDRWMRREFGANDIDSRELEKGL